VTVNDDDPRQENEARRDGETVRPAEEPGGKTSEEQRRREALEGLKRLRVADLVEEMLVGLVTVGYQKLGLTEQTRELRDLGDARLAIETLRAWIDVLARERGEEGLADLRSTVAAMQLSYARAAAEPSAAAAAAGADAAAAAAAADAAEPDAAGAAADETAGAEAEGAEVEGAGPDDTAVDDAVGPGPAAD
jgi:hypothetical protein